MAAQDIGVTKCFCYPVGFGGDARRWVVALCSDGTRPTGGVTQRQSPVHDALAMSQVHARYPVGFGGDARRWVVAFHSDGDRLTGSVAQRWRLFTMMHWPGPCVLATPSALALMPGVGSSPAAQQTHNELTCRLRSRTQWDLSAREVLSGAEGP